MTRSKAKAQSQGAEAAIVQPGASQTAPRASGEGWELRQGRWQDVLSDVRPDLLLFDAPYSAGTHQAATTRSDSSTPDGLTPGYESMSEADVRAFCEAWSEKVGGEDRARGWWVSITDSELFKTWRDEMARVGRYAFRAPVPVFIPGMSVRIQGDGPSSWTLYAAVSRPRTLEFSQWGTLPGYYGPIGAETRGRAGGSERGGGRGKQRAITNAFVRDYSKPGDLVCDPFAGWGGTLASALEYGRRAVGAEVDALAYAEALKRLARPQQFDMFAGVSGGAA